jgi:hypothetical protein
MGAGLAWACTPDAWLAPPELRKGSAETQLTLKGWAFPPRQNPKNPSSAGHVEVHLNGRALTTIREPELKTSYNSDSLGASFTKTVSIPHKDLPPDLYTVIAYGYDKANKLQGNAVQTFNIPVQDKGNAPTPPRDPASPLADPLSPDEPSGPGAGTSPATARGARSDRPTTGRSGSGGADRTRGAGNSSRAGGDPSPNGGAPSEGSGDLGLVTAPSGLVTAPSGQSLFRDSLPSSALTGGRRPFGQPSGRSASGDLWSGFGSGRTPSLEPRRGDPPAEEEAGLDIGLAAGTGFLGLGLAALFGSFLVAEVRRRRKAVHA